MSNLFNSPEVHILQASAGSGKTYALAKRYVQLLFSTYPQKPLALKHILAITFTNKASSQMKARIITTLKKVALGTLEEAQYQEIIAPLGIPVEKAQAMAREMVEDVIHFYHFFGVQTIDSFMNTLLCGCAFKLNLSARFKIQRQTDDYVRLSLDELIDRLHADKKVKSMLEEFIHQYLFLENRKQWFPKEDLFGIMKALFGQYNTFALPFVKFEQGQADLFSLKKDFVLLCRQLKDDLPEGTNKVFAQWLAKFTEKNTGGFDIDQISKSFKNAQPPLNKGAILTGTFNDHWDHSRQMLDVICLYESFAVFNPYVDLFNELLVYLKRIQSREDVLLLPQINAKAGELFKDGLTVEELYFRLAARFDHYLFDEFQDTSYVQWQNVRPMVEEALSSGGTLFYVGDKKQAIYGFRGGQSRLFDELKDQYAIMNPREDILSTNYRSLKQIIRFNNEVFSLENIHRWMVQWQDTGRMADKDIAFNDQDKEYVHRTFATSFQMALPHHEGGYVELVHVPGKIKEDRDMMIRQRLLEWVTELKERFALSDIAILTRNNMQVQKVTQWLVHEGIYAQSERTSDIKNHFLIMELLSFLRFIHSPIDNAALADFMLGELFPKVSGLSGLQVQEILYQWRQIHRQQPQYLYKYIRDQHADLWSGIFEMPFKNVGVYPLYEFTASVLQGMNVIGHFPSAQGFVMHLLELIKRKEEDGCDLDTFLDYFEQLKDEERFVPMPSAQAVQVMTVHKAKGLEFKAVIIPFLEMSINIGSSSSDGGQSFICDVMPDHVRLMRLKETYGVFSPALKQRYAAEYKEALFEELNNAYVALTRAAEEMYVMVPERCGNASNPAVLLFPEQGLVFGQKDINVRPKKKQEQTGVALSSSQFRDWVPRLEEEFFAESAFQAKARRDGDIVHFCLSQIGHLKPGQVLVQVEQSLIQAQMVYGLDHMDDLRALLITSLNSQSWQRYFDLPLSAKVMTEVEVVNRYGDTRRIDRLILMDQEAWVVDFKSSGLRDDQHQKQLDDYVHLVQAIYPKLNVRGQILYYGT